MQPISNPAADITQALAAQGIDPAIVASLQAQLGGNATVASISEPEQPAAPSTDTPAATEAAAAPAAAADAKPTLTPREKAEKRVAQAKAALEKAEAALAALSVLDNLAVGSAVEFEFGRADTKRILVGRVQAVDTQGGRANVYHGEGMDAQFTIVPLTAIKRVLPE